MRVFGLTSRTQARLAIHLGRVDPVVPRNRQMVSSKRLAGAVVCLILLSGNTLQAENWPNWRGPRGDGTSLDPAVPTHWSETENIAWKVDVPGLGHASPVVWGNRVFVCSCITD